MLSLMLACAVTPTMHSQSHRGLHAIVRPALVEAAHSMGHVAMSKTLLSSRRGTKSVSKRHALLVFFSGEVVGTIITANRLAFISFLNVL